MFRFLLLLLLPVIVLTGCQSPVKHPLLTPSDAAPVEHYSSFDDYVQQTASMLKANRYFLTSNREQEIKANLPFEVKPDSTLPADKGILLIHGLGDSPWSFVDISQALAEKGFLVRTVLLPGHGTRPGDMLDVSHTDWQALVSRQVELLKQEVKEVYLGGFSTGANLAYLHAANDAEIRGLILFSPGFKSVTSLIAVTPALSSVTRWLEYDDVDDATDYTKYSAMPTNGFAQYYHTSKSVLKSLEHKSFNRPVFIAASEDDSILDTAGIKDLFTERFTHPDSRLIWFGSNSEQKTRRIRFINSRVPELRVSNMSHMGILFDPNNPYYGFNGSERVCDNGQEEAATAICEAGKDIWFSAWGYEERGKNHARLTFNPAFQTMMQEAFSTFHLD
ncbi:alpha/beta hydrolase [Endozoicomonadaceae bacterium StTr2]